MLPPDSAFTTSILQKVADNLVFRGGGASHTLRWTRQSAETFQSQMHKTKISQKLHEELQNVNNVCQQCMQNVENIWNLKIFHFNPSQFHDSNCQRIKNDVASLTQLLSRAKWRYGNILV